MMFMLPLFALLRRNRLVFSLHSFLLQNLFILRDFKCHHPLWHLKGTSDPRGEKVFNWVISSDLFPINDIDIATLLHCSSGSRSSTYISFAYSSLSLSPINSTYYPSFSDLFPQRTSPFLQLSESLLGRLCLLF